MSIRPSPIIEQAQKQPQHFELVQLLRVINRHLAKAEQPFDIVVEADPMPDLSDTQVTALDWQGDRAVLCSSETSLSSGDATIPLYIYEELLAAFHQEEYALNDFLNILNDRYFKVYARTVEKSHLLLINEFDRYAFHNKKSQRGQIPLACCIAQLTGLPNEKQSKGWLGYGLMLGRPNRSIHDLQQILADYFALAIVVSCSRLSKHQLSPDNWTRIGKHHTSSHRQTNLAQNNQLGHGFLLGQRCWLSKQKIHITVEAESAQQLNMLTTDANWYHEMAQMSRYYLRDKTEIEIYLKAPDPWFNRTKLSAQHQGSVRLGRGFHIKSLQQDTDTVYLIHLVKD